MKYIDDHDAAKKKSNKDAGITDGDDEEMYDAEPVESKSELTLLQVGFLCQSYRSFVTWFGESFLGEKLDRLLLKYILGPYNDSACQVERLFSEVLYMIVILSLRVSVGFVAVVAIMGKLQCDWSVIWEIRLMFGGGKLSGKKRTGCNLMPI